MNYHRGLFSRAEWLALRGARLFRSSALFYRAYEATRTPIAGIEHFRDIHRGCRCFIMGGGPSLLHVDPERLKGEITFGVNCIFLLFDWLGFQPNYYAVEDSLVYEDRRDEIVERVTDSDCFFPMQFATPEFTRDNFNFVRFVYDFEERKDWPFFSKDASRVVWVGGTVTYMCLQLAFHMGIREVYLLGMDHRYRRPADVVVNGNEWTSGSEDPNHFRPDYFGPGKRWHDPRLDRMEKAYASADRAFRAAGGFVKNATSGGALETLERVSFDSLWTR